MALTSIRVSEDKLEIVNQLLLPHTTEFIEIKSINDAHDAIKLTARQIRGAPAIASLAALSVSFHLEHALKSSPVPEFLASPFALKEHLEPILSYLFSARPTAVNLGAATKRLAKRLNNALADGYSVTEVARALIAEGHVVADEDVGRNKAMAKWGGDWLVKRVMERGGSGTGLNVLTVCNTGSLATSGYGTALGLIRYLHQKGKLGKAYYTQTTPYHQGSRLTALELQTLKIPSIMICDTMVGSLFQHDTIHAVVVGADRVARNGDTANKIGTYNAAVLAARHRIPFIVVAPISSVDLDIPDGSVIPIEHRPAIEACLVRGALYPETGSSEQAVIMITPPGLEGIYNPSFDVTPAELITAIVTEKGVAVKRDAEHFIDLKDISENMGPFMYIAVHGGAGIHNRINENSLKSVLRQACVTALSSSSDNSALSVVESAISFLENDPHVNAGYGSNLTLDGHVECDAAIMDGAGGDYGSVGAVSGVKNPISLARSILEYSRIPDELGRLPPMTLVSDGARRFAATTFHSRINVQLVPPDELISPQAKGKWKIWRERLASSSEPAVTHDEDADVLYDMQDTVGAVTWVERDGTASGVSSGGLLLKYPGRIGEATIYGTGCWAQKGAACSVSGYVESRVSGTILITSSGAGEHIMRAMLARSIGEALSSSEDIDPHDILFRTLVDRFWIPCKDRGEINPNAGVLLLTKDEDTNSAKLWCAFTTPSMAIAYATTANPMPKAFILRRPQEVEKQSSDKPRVYITAFGL
ncbi:hypothetical protein AX17_001483 [Amanita inopinata Kibby_2008]|nr:hypothetical protein AX17_001483 [Amanita inopinata Kibby_2008]